MDVSPVLIARLLMADELDYSVEDLREMYTSEAAQMPPERDEKLLEELTAAIAEAAKIDEDETARRDNAKWKMLNWILEDELRKPEEEMNTDLIGEILDYLDEKGWS